MLVEEMRHRWAELAKQVSPHAYAVRTAFETLRALYSQPARYYHTFEHVLSCLKLLDEHHVLVNDPWVVEFSIWVHDAIYVPGESDNELCSAHLGGAMLTMLDRSDVQQDMFDIVLATRHHVLSAHQHHHKNTDANVVADIDLAILGSDRRVYQTYTYGILQEYRQIAGAGLYSARLDFLKEMLSRPHLFKTPTFREKFEAKARENMTAESEYLGKSVKNYES